MCSGWNDDDDHYHPPSPASWCLAVSVHDAERDTLVNAWIAYDRTNDANLFWAWDRVTDLVLEDPEVAWPAILALVRAAPDDLVLANVAAGPLEDLLSNHGASFIDRVETEARRDERF